MLTSRSPGALVRRLRRAAFLQARSLPPLGGSLLLQTDCAPSPWIAYAPDLASELELLFERLREFRSTWVSRGWSWDRRFTCVASTLGSGEAERAQQLVFDLLTQKWTSTTLRNAPGLITDVAEATGGVRSDQLLFATPAASVMAYGLWWPWGGGAQSISMRLGLVGRVSEADMENLRQVFGAPND